MADNDLKKRLLQVLVAAQDRERELENLCDDARPEPGHPRMTAHNRSS